MISKGLYFLVLVSFLLGSSSALCGFVCPQMKGESQSCCEKVPSSSDATIHENCCCSVKALDGKTHSLKVLIPNNSSFSNFLKMFDTVFADGRFKFLREKVASPLTETRTVHLTPSLFITNTVLLI